MVTFSLDVPAVFLPTVNAAQVAAAAQESKEAPLSLSERLKNVKRPGEMPLIADFWRG